MKKQRIYLDYNATAPMRPEVRRHMIDAFDVIGNPSSVHTEGRNSRRLVDQARESIAQALGCHADSIIFTSGGTEANNTLLQGMSFTRCVVSAIEHDSILNTIPDAIYCPVTSNGIVDLEALDGLLSEIPSPALVSIMLVNNETGVIQPLDQVISLCHSYGAFVHSDATQAIGRVWVHFDRLGVDVMTVSGHKLGGPQGIGALLIREGLPLDALMKGGNQEAHRRAGTENCAGIVGLAHAIVESIDDLEIVMPRLERWRDRLEAEVQNITKTAQIFGYDVPRVANTSCIMVPAISNHTQIMALDLSGIAVSSGAACSSGKVQTSHVLRAMGVDSRHAACTIRISFGWASREADVDGFLDAWRTLYYRVTSSQSKAEGLITG